jgi:hypothetical protein
MMSHLAPLGFMKAFQKIIFGRHSQGLAYAWGRLALLLAAAIFLSIWIAAHQVDADVLFQSPASPPPGAPGLDQTLPESPIVQPPVEQPPVEQSPVEVPPEAAPPAVEAGNPAAPLPPTAEPVRREREEEPIEPEESGGPSQFILDQAELIDTVVVSGAYIWLCCGVSLFLLVPLALLFVYIRGRSKIIREEGY